MDGLPIPRRSRPALWQRLEAVLRHGIWFTSFLVLARYLGPRAYGNFALAAGGAVIAEAGLRAVACRLVLAADTGDGGFLAAASLAVAAVGAAAAAALHISAGAAAAMFDDPGFADMIQIVSVVPLLGALGAVPEAELRRAGRFASLAAASGAGCAVAGLLAVALARSGGGVWALVAQLVIARFCRTVLLWVAGGRRFRLDNTLRHWRALAAGLDPAAWGAALPALARHAPVLLVALGLGPVAAGYFLLAVRLGEALCDIALVPQAGAGAAIFAAGAALAGSGGGLAIILPALTEPRWWGAIEPARVLLLAALPAAMVAWRRCGARAAAWQTALLLAAVALAVPFGLDAAAAAIVAATALAAVPGLAGALEEWLIISG